MSESDDFGDQSAVVPSSALFVESGTGLLIFPSAGIAESRLEPTDVAAGVYRAAFGPKGEPYRIRCEGNRVVIERTGEPDRPDDLKVLLLWHLEECEDPADSNQSLDDIVAIAWSIEENYRLRCAASGGRPGTPVPAWGWAALVAVLGAVWYFGLG